MNFLKKIFYHLPKLTRIHIVKLIELITLIYIKIKIDKIHINIKNNTHSGKKNILIYHISALTFSGTEKNLQMIAKYLNKDKYNVFIMHATDVNKSRLSYLENEKVKIIKFNYKNTEKKWPYFIEEMDPRLEKIINENNIDCIVTATPGQTIHPIINIRNIPIILINIFGSFSTQKNISTHVCISEEVKKLADRVVDTNKSIVQYIPSERPILNPEGAKKIREKFNINDTDLVFGRIGRADDSIFDPVALLAFEIVVKKYPDIHYIIMSPADLAKKLVIENKIPNVHWLEPSYEEKDVWAFHQAIDVLAHFRNDGESFGLNIAESMLVGNPILTHKSHIWNAHLEYLDHSFSRYSEKDDYEQYAKNMMEFIKFHKSKELKSIGQKAKEKAEKLFLIENNINVYEKLIDKSI